jgi:thiamine kinase-like enzyme
MTLWLNSENIVGYLFETGIYNSDSKNAVTSEQIGGKNFNLAVSYSNGHKHFVKQERRRGEDNVSGELSQEWNVHRFLQQFTELEHFRQWLPEIVHFDADNSIVVYNYFNSYHNLSEFYIQERNFAPEIATTLGKVLATIHKLTAKREDYQDVLCTENEELYLVSLKSITQPLNRLSPDIFGAVPMDGLKFMRLYQRYDSLGQAIGELISSFQPLCLIHGDLKLNNILLSQKWETNRSLSDNLNLDVVKIIDWELASWGDPAFDLGTVIASYLQIWLGSLAIKRDEEGEIDVEESLCLAEIPLRMLKPSVTALCQAYLEQFPEVLQIYPDFLEKVLRCAGLALFDRIQSALQYQKVFGNQSVCLLQVAKSLLCAPQKFIHTIMSLTDADLDRIVAKHA